MSKKTWILCDASTGRYIDSCRFGAGDVTGAASPFALHKHRLHGGVRDGVDVVEIDNGRLRLTVVPTRGMGIHRGECDGLRLGWTSPVRSGPVHPKFVPQDEATGIGWLSGFDEFLVRCGLEYCGAPEWDGPKLIHPLHGRIANLPAHYVEIGFDSDTQELWVTGVVDEARLFCNSLRLRSTLRTTLGSPAFTVTDEITNLSTKPGELELLYHINQGQPLAAPGSTFHAPIQKLVPKDSQSAAAIKTWNQYAPEAHDPELVYFFDLAAGDDGWTQTLLANSDGSQGLGVAFDRRQFPLFTLWKNPLPEGDGYVTGIEPCINLPHTKGYEKSQGRVAVLQPGETRRFDIRLEAATSTADVTRLQSAVESLQSRVQPQIFDKPQPGWSP
jgi:hypothetical protein